ncbi:hypothetical protein QWZ13_17025 [Reinekea marina]|nr:hypothetical protein [Reinekea marina]MDN3650610.1 hypothetical protein [Reinekea marina]
MGIATLDSQRWGICAFLCCRAASINRFHREIRRRSSKLQNY